jgi:uncharacterized protein YgiM (DUF1202 family)
MVGHIVSGEEMNIKKVSIIGLVIILALLLYLAFTLVFTILFRGLSNSQLLATRTPEPTFTPTPVANTPVAVVPDTPTPTPTPTPPQPPPPTATTVIVATDVLPTPQSTATPAPSRPEVAAAGVTVNVRAGPGTNYPVVATLPPGIAVEVIGRNDQGTWWQIRGPDGATGWVADSVVNATNVGGVPVAAAPAPPPQQPSNPTPAPTSPPPQPQHQYEPTGWYGDTNYGLTRFLGTITDASGNPVNGVFVEAQCGSFRIISNPSGPVGWGPFNESHTWSPGFYDITLDTRPIPCTWQLSVVETPDKETVTARLSERVEVETTTEQSVIVANWQKNW